MEQRRPLSRDDAGADLNHARAAHPLAGHDLASAADRAAYPSGLPPPLGDARNPGDGSRSDTAPAEAVEILSHELRSPITAIHLGTKVLRDGGGRIPKPVRREVVEAVEEEAERLYRLVEDILAVARHEDGATPLPVGPLLLQRWLRGIIATEINVTPALRVRAAIPSDLPPVLADDGALAQVVRNLLANAVRHAPDGMPVEVVAWAGDASGVCLEVCDRGPGIDPGEADRLFEPFYRSEAAQAQGSAAGLGLAAARSLIVAMGGSIAAVPRPGGGARFIVCLAVAPSDADAEGQAASEEPGRTRGSTPSGDRPPP